MDHEHHHHAHHDQPTFRDYLPLFWIALLLLTAVAVRAKVVGYFNIFEAMAFFEGLFFLVFGGLKLITLREFAHSYRSYDLLAKRSLAYAYAYPFIELALSAGYLTGFMPILVNSVTLVLMIIGAIGIFLALRKGVILQCACLGGIFKLPLSTISLVEDLLMAAMAAVMLLVALF